MAFPTQNIRGLTQNTSASSSPTISTSGDTAVDSPEPTPSNPICKGCHELTHTPFDDLPDPVSDLDRPCHGWPELVKVIVKNPGFEAFQAFRDLNIKSLLYYQAELVKIREDLHRLEWNDHRKGQFMNASKLCSRVDSLLLCERSTDERAKRQIEMVKKMRRVLKEYNAALLQYSQINELPEADSFNVNSLHTWIRKPGIGNGNLHIAGPGQHSWGDLDQDDPEPKSLGSQFLHLLRSIFWAEQSEKKHLDLVIPRKSKDVDGFTRWVASEFVPFWHNLCNAFKRPETPAGDRGELSGEEIEKTVSNTSSFSQRIWQAFGWKTSRESTSEETPKDARTVRQTLVTYSMSRMLRFTSFVATVVACLLPTVAIAVLSTMHTTAELLGFIALFTAIFAMGLMGLTDSGTSRTEIFTATAAFSAVLVVFVQNQNGGSYGTPG